MLATKDAMRLDEKAWVSIDSIQIDGEPSLGSPMKFIVKVKNTGKTPALSAAITQQGFGSKQTTALCPIERQLLLFSVVAPASQDSFYLSAKPDVSQGMLAVPAYMPNRQLHRLNSQQIAPMASFFLPCSN